MQKLSNLTFKMILDEFKKQTTVPYISLKAVRRPCTVFDSKFGGIPYMPKGFEYPYVVNSKYCEPLRLLAQLNFNQLPKLPNFPTQGILQFFVEESDILGINFNNPLDQSCFRVIYHKDIIQDKSYLQTILPKSTDDNSDEFPFQGEFKLIGKLDSCPMSMNDFRFDKTYLDIYKQHCIDDVNTINELDSSLMDKLNDQINSTGHHMGGYPFFTQSDPREYNKDLKRHTIMLLQIDSDSRIDEDEIIWGDCGVANFFIAKEALAKLDFSEVLYNWDCY